MTTHCRYLPLLLCLITACIRPGDDRPSMDQDVGVASIPGFVVDVDNGLAVIREFSDTHLVLWAEAPVLSAVLDREIAGPLRLTVLNCMPGAQLQMNQSWYQSHSENGVTECVFALDLAAGPNQITIAPRDYESDDPYRFAVMGDIQTALGSSHEVFEDISAIPKLRFLVCTGDIVQDGAEWEYELFQEKLQSLAIPIFTTVGNHEVRQPPQRWHDLFGQFSVHFRFKGVDFSLVDSGNASIDPETYQRLAKWLDDGRERVHIFATHFPPLDPIGPRNASFRSRNEGVKLLTRLAEGSVDLMLFGHIHSYYKYENAGIPAYVSGGGGAAPEQYDGIGRHFLVVDVDPESGLRKVARVPVNAR